MINVRELRLGNWFINQYGEQDQVDSIQEGGPNDWYDNGCEPIPLTEEVLLKCGFVWHDFENDPPDWLCWKVGTKSTLQTDRSCNFSFIEFATSLGRIKVQHLHQLQNLYFALTGEELTYTP